MTRFNRCLSRTSLPVSPRLSPAFSRPVWWAALAMLIINDHFLKGAGWAPGWLTGKLSDFAFLLVAPALAHAVFPVRWRSRRLLALLAVAMPFAIGKTVPACTHLLESVMGAVGVAWKLWTDPTDLIAFVVLPLAWRLLAPPAPRLPSPGRSNEFLQRAAVALGALACVATSATWARHVRPFVRNASTATEQVQVQWLLKRIPCTVALPQIARDLDSGDLSRAISIELGSDTFAALDMPPRTGTSPVGSCSNDPTEAMERDDFSEEFCPVVLLQAAGLQPVLTRTSGSVGNGDDDTLCTTSMSTDVRPAGEIRIENRGSGLRWVAGHHVEMMEFVVPASWSSSAPPAGSCQAIALQYEQDLRVAQSCNADQDCRPVATGACDAISASNSEAVDTDLASYATAGCSQLLPTCAPKPAICASGQCVIDCPLVHVGSCPRACAGTRTGDVCANQPCLNDQGDLCSCADGETAFTCAAVPAPPAGCRNWCL